MRKGKKGGEATMKQCGFVQPIEVARVVPPSSSSAAGTKGDEAANAYERAARRAAAARGTWGHCAFCGDPLAQQLRHGDAGIVDASLERAVAQTARLVDYDLDCLKRTAVIDDENDWYAVATSPWSTAGEAAQAWAKEEARREETQQRRRSFAIDLAGRRVLVEEDDEPPQQRGVADAPYSDEPPCGATLPPRRDHHHHQNVSMPPPPPKPPPKPKPKPKKEGLSVAAPSFSPAAVTSAEAARGGTATGGESSSTEGQPFSIVRADGAQDRRNGDVALAILESHFASPAEAFPPMAKGAVLARRGAPSRHHQPRGGGDGTPPSRPRGACVLQPGLVLLRGALPLEAQRAVVDVVDAVGDFASFPMYADGARLHCRMSCFGLRWDPQSNAYVQAGVPPVPRALAALARWAAAAAYAVDPAALGALDPANFEPDLLLANFYSSQGKMGLHRDDSERPETLDAGAPVVSISIGAAAEFSFADRRPDETKGDLGASKPARITLASGDILLLGGPSRLVYHGVEKIIDARKPTPGLALKPGRLNLTFRMH